MENIKDRLNQLYESFNARDIDAVLASLHNDVVWANGMEGRHVRGKDDVRRYWTDQWALIDPNVIPLSITSLPDGRMIVEVHQTVRDMGGSLLVDQRICHIFKVANDLVVHFDIRGATEDNGIAPFLEFKSS